MAKRWWESSWKPSWEPTEDEMQLGRNVTGRVGVAFVLVLLIGIVTGAMESGWFLLAIMGAILAVPVYLTTRIARPRGLPFWSTLGDVVWMSRTNYWRRKPR
jgi:hypothetical protein